MDPCKEKYDKLKNLNQPLNLRKKENVLILNKAYGPYLAREIIMYYFD